MNKTRYRVNVRIGAEFYEHLSQDDFFKEYPSLIVPSFNLINTLCVWIESNNGMPVEFSSQIIKDYYAPFIGRISGNNKNIGKDISSTTYCRDKGDNPTYTRALESLKQIGVITQTDDYKIAQFNSGIGHCRKYDVTPIGTKLIESSNLQYFKKLCADKRLQRQVQKSISKRKVRHRIYPDRFLQETHNLLMNLSYEFQSVDRKLLEDFTAGHNITSTLCHLIDIFSKTYEPLKRNETDSRVWHQLIALKSSYRRFLKFKDYRYAAVLDQRAAHPSYLGLFCQGVIKDSAIQLPPINRHTLETEIEEYNKLFNGIPDPRDTMAAELGLSKTDLKRALSVWINGGKEIEVNDMRDRITVTKVYGWYKRHYPQMTIILETLTPTRMIGPCISANYETKIFQDVSLYELALSMNLKLAYEYDGIGIFASNDEPDLTGKIEKIKIHIQEFSKKLIGFPIVLKVETIERTTDEPYPDE
jgi:hypothetical protein